jgi:hypothetical protein
MEWLGADLVGATGERAGFEEGGAVGVAGSGVGWFGCDGGFAGKFLLGRVAVDARQIDFFDLAALELRLDEFGEMPRAGEDDETAGVGIEPVRGSRSIARNRSREGRGSHNFKKIGLRSHQICCQ